MFLSAKKITEAIETDDLSITPFSEIKLKSASYTFTLDKILKDVVTGQDIDMPIDGYILEPGAFVIGKTVEVINLKNKYICILGTRSSMAQQGIDVLQGSTIAEPDTNAQLTLEISNNGPKPRYLLPGMGIAKGIFTKID